MKIKKIEIKNEEDVRNLITNCLSLEFGIDYD